jgi:serine/threonine protein kinase
VSESLGMQGEFRLLHKIGEGGMADVFLAERLGDDGFRTRVALKRLHRGLAMDSYFIRQLIREARLLGQLEHANIVKVYDLRRIGDEYYVVMEYVDGIDLAAVIRVHRKRKTRLPRPFFFHVALSLSESLAYAHAAVDENGNPTPLIHRDIKPSNVMLSRRGVVKLTDFGIAHVGDGSVTGGLVQGTANYMSPEQAFGEERLTPASDVFSLGAVFYELLTGKPLVDGDNYLKAIHQVRERRVTLEELASLGVEPGLRMVIAKLLSADIAGRYQEMESVRNDLQFVADRLKIDLSWHRIRAYVGRLMGILGRAPDRATLSNLQIPEEVRAAARQLGPAEIAAAAEADLGDSGPREPVTPATPPPMHLRRHEETPVTHAVEADLLDSQLEAYASSNDIGPELRTPPTPRPALPIDRETEPPSGDAADPATVDSPGPPTPAPASDPAPSPRLEPEGPTPPGMHSSPGAPQGGDPNRTVVYKGRSPLEAGVMGTGEMRAVRVEDLGNLPPAASSQALAPAPALVEFAATGAHAPEQLSPPTPATPRAAPPVPSAPPPPAPPAAAADEAEEVWIFSDSLADQPLPAAVAPTAPRRRKKRRRRRRPVPPLVTTLLVVLILLLLCAVLLVYAIRRDRVGEADPPAAERAVAAWLLAPSDESPRPGGPKS